MAKVIALGTVKTKDGKFSPGTEFSLDGDDLKRALARGAVRRKTAEDDTPILEDEASTETGEDSSTETGSQDS